MKTKLFALLLILLGVLWNRVTSQSDQSRDATKLLDTLFDSKKYDRRVRPHFGGAPTNVNTTIYLGSIEALSKSSLDLNLDIYLRQSWFDDRLVFNKSIFPLSTLTLSNNYPAMIWLPDTFFPNSKSVLAPQTGVGSPPTPSHSSCKISQDGRVFWSQRLKVAVACPMDLHLFPFDVHECKLEIESYAYSDDDIKYSWDGERAASIDTATIFIPSMELRYYGTKNQATVLSTGSYSRLSLRLLLRRRHGHYILQFYTPLAMLTVLSWLPFWLDRTALTAKLLAGLVPLATATMLTFFSSSPMPEISYVKAMDVYSGFCLLMIFSSLVECAIANYVFSKVASSDQMSKPEKAVSNSYVSNLDQFCRAAFPIIFTIFNLLYWTSCTSLAANASDSFNKAQR